MWLVWDHALFSLWTGKDFRSGGKEDIRMAIGP